MRLELRRRRCRRHIALFRKPKKGTRGGRRRSAPEASPRMRQLIPTILSKHLRQPWGGLSRKGRQRERDQVLQIGGREESRQQRQRETNSLKLQRQAQGTRGRPQLSRYTASPHRGFPSRRSLRLPRRVSPPRQRGFCLPASVRRHGPPAAPWGTILSRAPSRCGGVPRAGRWQHMARRD